MADPDLSFLQTLIEGSLAQQATFSERVERIERVLLHLSRQMEALTHKVDGLPDLVALQVSEAFERRFSRIANGGARPAHADLPVTRRNS
jgi:hypothetical protein